MLPFLDELKPYGQYWFVTITPYGRDIEPNVPDKETVMEGFKELSDVVGADSMGWRYVRFFIDKNILWSGIYLNLKKWLKFLLDTQRLV